jgi:hypothetical protein
MAFLRFAVGELSSLVGGLVEPVMGGARRPIPEKQINQVSRTIDGAAGSAVAPRMPDETRCVALAVPLAQLKHVQAEPAVRWSKDAWHCREATTLILVYVDGSERRLRCPEGTTILVTAGLLHVPPGVE